LLNNNVDGISAVEEDVLFKAELNYAFTYGQHWHLGNIQAQEAWNLIAGQGLSNGGGIQNAAGCYHTAEVAILDVGVDTGHIDLRGRLSGCTVLGDNERPQVVEDYNWNCFNGNSNITAADVYEKHCTPIAGIVTANSINNNYTLNVAGNYVKAQILKVGRQLPSFQGFMDTTLAAQVEGFDRAASNPKCVAISVSWGSTAVSPALSVAIDYVVNQSRGCTGIPVFVAAGNIPVETLLFPANDPNTLAIGASDSSNAKTSWTNYGADVFAGAPGTGIRTLDRTGNDGYSPLTNSSANADINNTNAGTMLFTGTSASAPIAACVAACMRVVNPSLTVTQIKEIFTDTCLAATGLGAGIVRMQPAIEAAIDLISAEEDLTVTVGIDSITPNPGSICSNAPTVVAVGVDGSGDTWATVTSVTLEYFADVVSATTITPSSYLLYSQSFPINSVTNTYTTAFTIPNVPGLLSTGKMIVRATLGSNCGQIISNGATDFVSTPLGYTITAGSCPGTDLAVEIVSWSYNNVGQRVYVIRYTNVGTTVITSANVTRGWLGGGSSTQTNALSLTGSISPGQFRITNITFTTPPPQLPAIYFHRINTVNGSVDSNLTNNYSSIAVNS
jgi:hypothetical protein